MANTVVKQIWEIFEEVGNAKTRKTKLNILKKYEELMPLRDVLQGTFDPNIQWNLPAGTPPYTPQADGAPTPTTLLKQHLNFKYFVKGLKVSENLGSLKREKMFIDMLESVAPQDATILLSMVSKKKPEVDGLTEKLVKEAFPDLIP